jgi:hypothetical protein
MTNEIIRIYSSGGFVFEISYDWVLENMSENQFLYSKQRVDLKNKLDVLEHLRRLNWPDIIDHVTFVGVIEDAEIDLMRDAVLDLKNSPLYYPVTKQKALKFKIANI